jgi:hypothetical protein
MLLIRLDLGGWTCNSSRVRDFHGREFRGLKVEASKLAISSPRVGLCLDLDGTSVNFVLGNMLIRLDLGGWTPDSSGVGDFMGVNLGWLEKVRGIEVQFWSPRVGCVWIWTGPLHVLG